MEKLYVVLAIIVLALLPKIYKDVQKGIDEGNEKKRQKDLTKEINDSKEPAPIQDACRFCQFWKESLSHPGIGNCLHPDYFQQRTQSTHYCELFRSTGRKHDGSNQEATGNNSGSTGEASRKH